MTHHEHAIADDKRAPTLYRPRLLRRLKGALHTGHVLITAPPGYGKTTLLRSLLTERPNTHLLVLTTADADLAVLQSRMKTLLQRGSTVLIDDVHLVADEPEVLAWLHGLLHTLNVHLVVSGRTIPSSLIVNVSSLPVPLTIFDADDLAFTLAECRMLLQHVSYSADDIASWHVRTQGWPLALMLFAQHARGGDDVLALPLAEADVFTYLAQVMMSDLPPSLRLFMERTALPLRFDDELAASLIGDDGNASALRAEVQRRNLFLDPAEEPGWFRYHALVRAFLLQRDPDLLSQLTEHVVTWFESHGDVPMAIEHTLQAGMQERAACLIEGIAPLFVMRTGRLRTYRRWIEALDDGIHTRFPHLLSRT